MKTNKLFPYLETDNERQKELLSLYNEWYRHTAFKSTGTIGDKYWKKLEEYCLNNKELTKAFWMELYAQFGEVGHFTAILFKLFPNYVEVVGYCPLKDIEEAWMISFIATKK